ncbi:MAG: type II secretion system protein, partial [Acidobacteria bacterium]|nr:type II secretion system protein [Acidobacteriota bacterium]
MENRKPNWAVAKQSGFSLIELMIVTVVLLAVSGIVLTAMYQMTMRQASISNRTEMHSGVRSVTGVLQQEISQAGRVAFPTVPNANQTTTMNVAVVGASPDTPVTIPAGVADPAFLFDNMHLIIDIGDNEEIVTAINWNGITFTGTFEKNHAINALVRPAGAFAEGILANSTGTVLKLFGDINDNGNMRYVEYTCDTVNGFLYRNEVAWDAGAKPAVNASMILLSNLRPNPNDAVTGLPVPCFTYQRETVPGSPYTFTLNVGVTLTANPQSPD